MTSPLSGIAVDKRRRLAATLGLFATLFLAVGAVAATSATDSLTKVFVAVALLVAAALGLMAWGVLRSVRLEAADGRLDAAIEAAVRASGRSLCDCGHEHDPDDLHVVEGEAQHLTGRASAGVCAHDGTGDDCAHSCDTCVLASTRLDPAAAASQAAPRRPKPGPAPR